jgi:ubiquinone/menaquinone biosynthesis C-methylase UbiE
MPDPHYDEPELAALYDITCGWREDRDYYLRLAGAAPIRVLDLGCGTGLLCGAYARRGHEVIGVDPSAAMLEQARRQPQADRVEWVLSSAQAFRSQKRFDLIVMTGHAFQVLEEDADIAAGLATIRRHLAPEGRAVFESRNPQMDWAKRWQGEAISYVHDGRPVEQVTSVLGWTGDRLTFEQRYRFFNRELVSTSRLRFAAFDRIAQLIAGGGLSLERAWGDWQERAFDTAISDEMIFCVRPKESPRSF